MGRMEFTLEEVQDVVRLELDGLGHEVRSLALAFNDFQGVAVENLQELTDEIHEQLVQVRAEMRGLRDFIE